MVTMATTYTTQLHHFELDLSAACYPNSISGRLNDVVPVLKTSTGKEDPSFLLKSASPLSRPFSMLSRNEGTGSAARGPCICMATPSTRHHGLPKPDKQTHKLCIGTHVGQETGTRFIRLWPR